MDNVKTAKNTYNRRLKRVDLVAPEKIKKRKKVASKPPRTKKELNRIFDEVYALNGSLYQLFHMQALTGLRFSDAAWLMIEDFYDEKFKVFKDSFQIIQQKVYNMSLGRSKAKYIRDHNLESENEIPSEIVEKFKATARQKGAHTVFVNDEMLEIVHDIIAKRKSYSGYLFPNGHHHSNNLPISTNGANDILAKVRLKLKINYPLTTHSFRKWFANLVIKLGYTPEKTRDLLGQSSLDVTTLYVDADHDELSSVIKSISYNN